MASQTIHKYTLGQLILYFFKPGYSGFGGPVALVMHLDLVENRKWISEEEYIEGLALAQLAPGPLAAQLGIYLGYLFSIINWDNASQQLETALNLIRRKAD